MTLFWGISLNAQNRANNWYFGFGAGITFNSGVPVTLLDGQLRTREGCATISDNGGNLLFYTDGIRVYNKNHQIMSNGSGLHGDPSSTHSAVIVPKPGSSIEYYVFTTDIHTSGEGFQYSMVDMSLDGGLGDVTIKNVPLASPVTEKIASFKKTDTDEYWVVVRRLNSNEFLAFDITASGVGATPVGSAVGMPSVSTVPVIGVTGQLKISPDGKRIASNNSVVMELFDFDETTGKISNPTSVSGPGYGVEFSPDSSLLYVAYYGGVCQYNLAAGSYEDIENSRVDLNKIAGLSFGSLQRGPDGKIYGVKVDGKSLDVIHSPNTPGLGCDYRYDDVYLGERRGFLGLPTFISNIYMLKGDISIANTCFGDTTAFTIPSQDPSATIHWDFGDGATSSLENPTHTYTASGNYTVSVTITLGQLVKTESSEFTVYEVPVANPVALIESCHLTEEPFSMDLATLDDQVLGAQSPENFEVGYFLSQADAETDTNPLTATTNFNIGITTLYAKVFNKVSPVCYDLTAFDVLVKRGPRPLEVKDWIVCDDGDGQHTFDLATRNMEILGDQDPTEFTITYHPTQLDATDGTNALGFAYTSTLGTESIYFRIANSSFPECFETGSFDIGLIDQVLAHTPTDLAVCDTDNNGEAEFDLTQVEGEVLGAQSSSGVIITYHSSQNDADNNSDPLPTVHTSSSQQQAIFVRVSNAQDGFCFSTTSFQLNLFETPEVPKVSDWWVCDDDNDGRHWFDLEIKADEISGGASGVDVSFYTSEVDAQSAQDPILGNYLNIANPQTVYFRVGNGNNSNCFSVGSFQLQVFDAPTANRPADIVICDDAQTGTYPIDLSSKDVEVLNGQDPSFHEVSYYSSELDALNSDGPLSKEEHFNGSIHETIYARVQHNQLSYCYAVTSFNIIVNPLPVPNLEEVYVICPESPELMVDGGVFETYIWRNQDGDVIGNQQYLGVTELGIYELTVTESKNGFGCSNTMGFEVVSSGAPDSFTVDMEGFSDRITLKIETSGLGAFEYSIDGYNYQSSNQFEVFPGPYTLYVRDPLGCRTLSKEVIALGYLKFFTPNGDGVNDQWNIVGRESSSDSQLYIYDKYGKLLRQISPTGPGWDGTFLGRNMPSSDYWFRYVEGNGLVQTGHFSLRR